MAENVRIIPAGDCAVVVEFGNEISEEINGRITGFVKLVEAAKIQGVQEAVPTFRSVLIAYRPNMITFGELCAELNKLLEHIQVGHRSAKRIIEIPVCYGGEYGPDLAFVAQHAGMSEEEVIKLHTSTEYLIYMLGFQPGFPYLGGLDERLFTPRLESPRVQIPAGSVGIGGKQTGLYPIASPAGWQIIGTTPVKCYNIERNPEIPYHAGDYIHFYSITAAEYAEIAELEKTNGFVFQIHG